MQFVVIATKVVFNWLLHRW